MARFIISYMISCFVIIQPIPCASTLWSLYHINIILNLPDSALMLVTCDIIDTFYSFLPLMSFTYGINALRNLIFSWHLSPSVLWDGGNYGLHTGDECSAEQQLGLTWSIAFALQLQKQVLSCSRLVIVEKRQLASTVQVVAGGAAHWHHQLQPSQDSGSRVSVLLVPPKLATL